MEARTSKNTRVWFEFQPDCGDNVNGYYVEIYLYDNSINDFDMETYYDSFCVHATDCDCKSEDAVIEYCKKYISEISEY